MQAHVQQIAKIIVFANLEPEILAELSNSSSLKSYKKNEIIIHEGDLFAVKLYAIIEGSLLIKKIAN